MLPHLPLVLQPMHPLPLGPEMLPPPSLAHALLQKVLFPEELIKPLSWCIFTWFHVYEQLKEREWCGTLAYVASCG